MNFYIYYDKQPQDFLKKAEKHIAKRIMDKLDSSLSNNPVPHNVKAVVGEHGVFSLRIGDYRTLYRINYQENKIIIVKLDKRPRVYG